MKELALNVLDIAENCIAAGADKVLIQLEEFRSEQGLMQRMVIEDNGRGMNKEVRQKASDPFFTSRTTRKVGMGLPLLRQHAEMAGGSFTLSSEEGKGTRVEASFQKDHPDRQPLGDLEGSWMLLVVSNPGIEWILDCKSGEGEFKLSTAEIKQELDLEVIRGSELTESLKGLIRNNINALGLS